MGYLCKYNRKSDGKYCARYIPRGFACTREELPREVATACRAIPETLAFEHYSPEAATVYLDDAEAKGYKIEGNFR